MHNFVYQMSAIVIIGFVKDAKHHVDVQGFNVYHKNRLIKVSLYFIGVLLAKPLHKRPLIFKINSGFHILVFFLLTLCYQPFWRIWNTSGSDGRGVIGTVFIWKFYYFIRLLYVKFTMLVSSANRCSGS